MSLFSNMAAIFDFVPKAAPFFHSLAVFVQIQCYCTVVCTALFFPLMCAVCIGSPVIKFKYIKSFLYACAISLLSDFVGRKIIALARILSRYSCKKKLIRVKLALAGNRTRAPRVAGEDSTTEPPMLCWYKSDLL